MEHYLYEKDNQGRVMNFLESFTKVEDAIAKAKRMANQWAQVGITRHYLVSFHDNHEREN
jgi:uncharacterized protein (UPF0548 family)